ncbi:UNVERIFIED_CONTAM: Gamma carbonic anhydrase-like 2, mitochondrial [Sesamum indicum]
MGRGKVELKRIENATNRQVTFSKRRNGLLKKAFELSVLCDAEVALLIFSPSGKAFQFSSHDMQRSIARYKSEVGMTKSNDQGITTMEVWRNEIEDMKRTVDDLEARDKYLSGENLSGLGMKELKQLERQLRIGVERIRSKKRILILNLFSVSAIKNQAERRKVKMATLARIGRRLPRALSITLPGRAFSAQAAQSAENPTPPAPVIRESPDRVKWDYRGQRKIIPLGQWAPKIAVDAYVAPNVVLAGQVVVYDGASVWNGAVLRGDLNKITVGFCSNVQERCVIHAAWSSPTGQIFDSVCYTLRIGGCTFGFTFLIDGVLGLQFPIFLMHNL